MWKEIKKVIHQHDNFLLTTHVSPDGDGIGSAAALIELLKMMNKEVRFSCDSPIPVKFRFLDFYSLLKRFDEREDFSGVEVLILVDTHKKERIGRLASLISNPKIRTLLIDHHEVEGPVSPYAAIDPNASSTGSMIYTLFKECGYDLNLRAAMGLYASIVCDTGRFCYSSTDRKAHKIAEECIKKGVDPDWMYSHLFRQVTLAEFKVLAKILQSMESHCDNRVILQTISRQDCEGLGEDAAEILHSDLEYVHEFNKLVVGVECAVLLREMEGGNIRVSLRSLSNLPIDQVTRELGGGGHKMAAGAMVKGSLQEVKKRVIVLLDQALTGKNT